MTEGPTKLFPRRSEQYPEPRTVDVAHGTVRAGLAAIPFVGGSITELMSMILQPAVATRRDEWFKDLADDFEKLEKKVDGFKLENLIENEAFVSATITATRIAIGTHQEEKRKYLRNALLNIAVGKGLDEIRQQIFLNAIEAFTPAHVKALNLIWRSIAPKWDQFRIPAGQRTYGTAIGIVAPEVQGQPAVIDAILAELRNRSLTTLSVANTQFPQGGVLTNLTADFLNFVLSPEELPK